MHRLSYECLPVDPHQVNLHDQTFYFPHFGDSSTLVESIKRVGVLNPPFIQQLSDGMLIPVAGRRRLEAAVQVGMSQLDAKVLPSHVPAEEGFRLAFWDNCAHRAFGVAAQAVLVKRLFQLYPLEVISTEFLPALGVPPRGPRLARLRSIGGLEPPVLEALASGRIMEKTAAIFAEVAPEDRNSALELINALGTNANINAEVVGNLFDLSTFQNRRISDLLQDPSIRLVLEDRDLPKPEKTSRVRRILRSWKFPELVREEEGFQRWCEEGGLPSNVAVRPSQAFETQACTVEIKLKSREHTRRLLEQIREDLPL